MAGHQNWTPLEFDPTNVRAPGTPHLSCNKAAESGGSTPVVDGVRWLATVAPEIRDAFAGRVRYTQNPHGGRGLGKSWQDNFEMESRADGSPIQAENGAQVCDCGLKSAVDVVLLIDNVLVGHGRRPFTKPRRVLMAMSD